MVLYIYILQIGNPLLELNNDLNSMDDYSWSHGLISDDVYELLTKVCNSSQIFRGRFIADSLSPACKSVLSQRSKEMKNTVDFYNVLGNDHCIEGHSQMATLYEPQRSRIQALLTLSLHSQPDALGDHHDQVNFTHVHVCLIIASSHLKCKISLRSYTNLQ